VKPVGVVLAGGAGRRIGGDKATVELAGRPLLLYPLAAVRAVLRDVAVVAKRDTALPPLDAAVAIWLEPDEPRHPLSGVLHALQRARGRPVLVVAGDLPLLAPSLVRRLARAGARGAPAVVPRAGGRLQPLCARYDAAALPALEGFDPAQRLSDVVTALGPLVLDVDDETSFFNVNRPEDLLQASALLGPGRGGDVRVRWSSRGGQGPHGP